MDPKEEREEAEALREDFAEGLQEGPKEGEVRFNVDPEEQCNEKQYDTISCSPRLHKPLPTKNKKRPSKREIHTINYAFGEPRIDKAAKEAQDWLDGLSIAEEDENNPKRNIFPHGLKYRSASANLSPQMFERLQKCQENQESNEPPKNHIMSSSRNSSLDVHLGLHEEDHCNRPCHVWKGRRTAAGNNSLSVYAVLHPQAQAETSGLNPGPLSLIPPDRCSRHVLDGGGASVNPDRCSIEMKPSIKRNYLRDHMAAIAEMSFLTHNYKEEERKQEAKRLDAIKYWGGGKEIPKKKVKRQPAKKTTNFVEKNMETITEQSAYVNAFKTEPVPDVTFPHKQNIGRVPEYLHRIKTELAQETERRALEEATKKFPPGRRLMSEVNRRHILEKLENKHKELIHTLKAFPLMFDTPRQIQLKSSIEQQLRKIEASHKYYDNPKVYISCLDINCPTCMRLDDHFFRDPLRTTPNSPVDDLWEHMACAAGIQKSPRKKSPEVHDRGVQGATTVTKKRQNEGGDEYLSPSKRQNTSPQKLFRQYHNSSLPRMWGVCKKCSPPRR